jgi:glycosyltransferase involved in cell wall biosynthesis
VTSPSTRCSLAEDYGLRLANIHVVQPGIDQPIDEPPARRVKGPGDAVTLLSVGSLVPRKGFDILLQALAMVETLDWSLTIVGDLHRSKQTTEQIISLAQKHKLTNRVHFAGAVSPEDLQHLYRDADLFVLASRYEGFGMAYTEALAWALPVIATRAGAISHTLQGSGAQLVASEDTKALAKCLQALIGDSDLRAQLGLKALQFAKTQGDWQHAAKSFEQVLTEMSTESADLGQVRS